MRDLAEAVILADDLEKKGGGGEPGPPPARLERLE
jgi:hypothetical protein